MLNYARALLRWRRGQPLLRLGDMKFLDAPEPLLWFERRDGAASMQAVFNLSGASVTLNMLQPILASLADTPFSGATLKGDVLTLPPYGVFMGEPLDPA